MPATAGIWTVMGMGSAASKRPTFFLVLALLRLTVALLGLFRFLGGRRRCDEDGRQVRSVVPGAPKRLCLDTGPEFISAALRQWAQRHRVTLVHIHRDKPTQNAYIERFNRTLRTEVLDRFVFTMLDQVRRTTKDWRHRYNHHRPHRSLNGRSPPLRDGTLRNNEDASVVCLATGARPLPFPID